jgi:hypothetical protein
MDPAVRPDPTTAVHGNRSHLGFGGGPHECPGQDMARAIADTGIDTLMSRLPDLHVAVPETELRWRSSLMSRHLVELPVGFSTSAASRPSGAADGAPAWVAGQVDDGPSTGTLAGGGAQVHPVSTARPGARDAALPDGERPAPDAGDLGHMRTALGR